MSYEEKTLFGFPIVITDAMPKGVIITGPLPTAEDLLEHGSFENYVEARKKEFGMITGLDDGILSADEIG